MCWFLFVKHAAGWIISWWNFYIKFSPHETDFFHGTRCVLIFVHETCILIFLLEKLILFMELVTHLFLLWCTDFYLFSLLHVCFSLLETCKVNFILLNLIFAYGKCCVLIFAHGTCYILIFVNEIFCMLNFLLLKLVNEFLSSWNWYCSWKLLYADFCSWNLLHVDFSLHETCTLIFLLLKLNFWIRIHEIL